LKHLRHAPTLLDWSSVHDLPQGKSKERKQYVQRMFR
jgi:hypothetical protein